MAFFKSDEMLTQMKSINECNEKIAEEQKLNQTDPIVCNLHVYFHRVYYFVLHDSETTKLVLQFSS
ncbi:hypothetical protein T4E_9753 [Trichinella pseudospiralis]|uniref:Uncharacterized protein n=1 Tax=Trichinella pseudospiralis TaxID=6337 RepID=A0A0V0XHQ7_TRIPS|nr:hypothetical protein T4E_9753 [Trichinella pseudospiralis]